MSVYVDKSRNKYKRMIMCHMLADSIDELHAMADKLGLKRSWYQPKSTPHYDLNLEKRRLAIRLGAIEIDNDKVVSLIKSYKEHANGRQS